MKFYENLSAADNEKLVEAAYHYELRKAIRLSGFKYIDIKIENNTDGILEAKYEYNAAPVLKVIIETKCSETFQKPLVRAKVLIQVVCYLKKQNEMGGFPPNIILIGDKDECFTLHTRYLQKYILMNIQVINSPSTAWQYNPEIIKDMVNNTELQEQCFVYLIDEDFKMANVVNKMISLLKNIKLQIPITEKSIRKIFDYFSIRILVKSVYKPREQVEHFMFLLLNPDDCMINSKKHNVAFFGSKQIQVNEDAFLSFTNFYEFKYNIEEKKSFTAICDRLIEDCERRYKGDFFTPTIWTDEAILTLSNTLGENWKDEYVVWDNCCGTKNLTRDYKFKRLYSSTLEQYDLNISERYNKEDNSTWAFQYDFLNDDVDIFEDLLQKKKNGYKLVKQDFWGTNLYNQARELVLDLLLGKPLIFFINPPFSTTGNMNSPATKKGNKNSGLGSNKIGNLMLNNNIGGCSQQLYAQFLYRIIKIKELFDIDVKIGLFSPTLLFTGKHFKWFREELKNKFVNGFMFKASEFSDVTGSWAISFTVWDLSKNAETETNLMVKTINIAGIEDLYNKRLYSVSKDQNIREFIKTNIKTEKVNMFTMSTAISVTDGEYKHDKDSLCYLFMDTPRIEYNNQFVNLINNKMKGNKIAVPLYEDNYLNCLSTFTARKLITGQYADWINCKDEYMLPDINHPLYKQWESDCIIYSIFNPDTHLTSLRNIKYKNNFFNLYNNFFFMSKQDILELAQGKISRDTLNNNVEIDILNYAKEERFIYKKLKNITLSSDAQSILNKSIELIYKSFYLRKLFNSEHPEYQIENWDAGWHQVKALIKEYFPEDLKEFNSLYKNLEDRMRPLVYQLKFLYK